MRKEIKGNKNRPHDWTKKAPKPCEVLKPLEHRATTNAGKPVSVLRGIAEKNVAFASFLLACSVLV